MKYHSTGIMNSVEERLKIKRAPTDIWSIREQLCLAHSVLKSGDQNWISVSRALKSVLEKIVNRSNDWFSQKSCAQQYAYLLENADIPKRKKRESGETTSEFISRRLTQDRLFELNEVLATQKDEFEYLKNEIIILKTKPMTIEKLKKMWILVQTELEKLKSMTDQCSQMVNTDDSENCEKRNFILVKDPSKCIAHKSQLTIAVSEYDQIKGLSKAIDSDSSTSLFKLNMPLISASHNEENKPSSDSNSMLSEVRLTNNSPNQNYLCTIPTSSKETTMANAPTLSKLLENPTVPTSTSTIKNIEDIKERVIDEFESKKTDIYSEVKSSVKEVNPLPISEVDALLGKDEMSDIIEDIEELIEKERKENSATLNKQTDNEVKNIVHVHQYSLVESEDKANESTSHSNSPHSEISLGEIDSSTSNIAEIIGTSIDTSLKTFSNEVPDNNILEKNLLCSMVHSSGQQAEKLGSKELPISIIQNESIKETQFGGSEIIDNGNNQHAVKNEVFSLEESKITNELSFNSDCKFIEKRNNIDSSVEVTLTKNDCIKPNDSSSSFNKNSNRFNQTSKTTSNNDSPHKSSKTTLPHSVLLNNSDDILVSASQKTSYEQKDSKANEVQSTIILEIKKSVSEPSCTSTVVSDENISKSLADNKDAGDKSQEQNLFINKFDNTNVNSESISILKKECVEYHQNVDDLDEEPILSKYTGGRAVKTYSKKQNAVVECESENENCGETPDYRAWKKYIMLFYNRLATHKYASIFLRPITEDQAPGYHSIIYRPMDLWTLKKNIDNGIIRSTTHFQRDVLLMFQNAIMFNKYNTLVHKMSLEMQEECLQHMQVLVQATEDATFRRETRTATISNDSSDSNLKRKWAFVSNHLTEYDNIRIKKQKKNESD